MLCAGVVHGDLSDFNVLMGIDGPVVIDFPQSVDPAHNQNARKLLLRDVDNLHRFLERFSPTHVRRGYAMEMWSLYESNRLEPGSELRGDYRAPQGKANTEEVLALIDDAKFEERARRHARGEESPSNAVSKSKPLREVIDFTQEPGPRQKNEKRTSTGRGARPDRSRGRATNKAVAAKASVTDGNASPKKRRSRRRRKRVREAGNEPAVAASQDEAAAKKATASNEASEPKRRRRRRRSGTHAKSEETMAGTRSGVKRPAEPGAGTRGGGDSTGTDRPTRRRRRRPRTARSSEAI